MGLNDLLGEEKREGHVQFNHNFLASLESRDGVVSMKFIADEQEHEINACVLEDLIWLRRGFGDMDLDCAVFDGLL